MPDRYQIFIPRRVLKRITSFDRQDSNRIGKAIDALAIEPRPVGCLKVQAEDKVWRIRAGDYRIGYIIDDAAKSITIVRVGHRSDFYKS